MLNSKKQMGRMSNFPRKPGSYIYKSLALSAFTIMGLMSNIFPSTAFVDSERSVTDTYKANEYRVCAKLLHEAGVSDSTTLKSCGVANRPLEFSSCVSTIRNGTTITVDDTVNACRKAYRPQELAVCVTKVSQNTEQKINPEVLSYCGRSVQPLTFAKCVVGLRKEIPDLTPLNFFNGCSSASDQVTGISPGSTITPSQY